MYFKQKKKLRQHIFIQSHKRYSIFCNDVHKKYFSLHISVYFQTIEFAMQMNWMKNITFL